jgi:hypothetical protein
MSGVGPECAVWGKGAPPRADIQSNQRMSPPKIEGSPPNSLSPRPREQGPVSPMVPSGSGGSETPPKEASPGIVGTKRAPPSDTESAADRSSRQRTEGSLRPDGRGAPGTSLAAGLKTPPASPSSYALTPVKPMPCQAPQRAASKTLKIKPRSAQEMASTIATP